MMRLLHREWRSHWYDTLALLEAEEVSKRHSGSGRPQENQGGIVWAVNHGESPGLCLQGRAGWCSNAHPALATARIMPDPAPTSQFISSAPWPQPPLSWSSSRPTGLFVSTCSKQECGASQQNISFAAKISPEQAGESWTSCAPRQQWDDHVFSAGQRSTGTSQGHREKDNRHQCWQPLTKWHEWPRDTQDVLRWPHTSGKATGIYWLVFPLDRP